MNNYCAFNTRTGHSIVDMSFRRCVHCNREYESLFDRPTCSSECAMEISSTTEVKSGQQ